MFSEFFFIGVVKSQNCKELNTKEVFHWELKCRNVEDQVFDIAAAKKVNYILDDEEETVESDDEIVTTNNKVANSNKMDVDEDSNKMSDSGEEGVFSVAKKPAKKAPAQ